MIELFARATADDKTVILTNSVFGERTMTINMEHRDFVDRWNRYSMSPRVMIQDAFPDLNASEREFLISGVSPEDWNEMFGGEEPDSNEEDDEI